MLYSILASQLYAPLMILDIPSFKKINVKKVLETPALPAMFGNITNIIPGQRPKLLHLILNKNYEWIQIDLENESIFSINGNPTNEIHNGSAGIGIAIFGLPSLILTSPLLILNAILWKAIESHYNMTRHMLVLWLKIKDQIPEQYKEIVHKSFIKYCKDYV